MRHFDLTPLYKSTIGFDRLASLIDSVSGFDGESNGFPPYNIETVADNEYRISMAVAGFGEDELEIEAKENTLSIRGKKTAETDDKSYLHRGIAMRNFERRFQLADYVEVRDAELDKGMLHVDLVRELPEKMKPRQIEIKPSDKVAPQLESTEV